MNNMKRYIMICATVLLGFFSAQAEDISIEDVVINKGETKTFTISLTNSHTDLVSFQMDLYLPDGITLNKNCVPGEKRSPAQASGVRIGTAPMTTKGFTAEDFINTAHKIDEVIRSMAPEA